MKRLAILLGLVLAWPLAGQTVTMPAEIKTPVGRLAAVAVAFDGDDVRWVASDEIDSFREYDPDVRKVRLRFIGYAPGSYHLHAVACKAGKMGDFATCKIVVGDPLPPVPPVPPVPPLPPDPPKPPAPIPDKGLRVLIVYESAALSAMPAAQQAVLYSQTFRDLLNAKCAVGSDGKTREWRVWDKDVATDAEAKLWQDAMRRPRAAVPWIVVSNGAAGFEGPLPATVADATALVAKYAGN